MYLKTLRHWALLGMLSITGLYAQAQIAPDAVTELSGVLMQLQSMSGQFSQLSLDASGTRLQESSGDMLLKRPGQLRWHTNAPMEQLLVSNGQTTWLYDPDLNQVVIQKLDQRLTHTPALLLSGDLSHIAQNFTVTLKQNGTLRDFTLIPKAADTLFESLRLSFRGPVLNDMQLVDTVGQRTNIVFSKVVMNAPVADTEFVFEPPKGADVIQE